MTIKNMFADDINRKINGVIKVDQEDATTEREVKEYVITKELKKHFISFFNYYSDSFDEPTDDIGVWISGFFGSGKSHFLKMLSYILENREINGVKTVERFREKFEDDAATFMMIDKATRKKTETILFNIDIEGPINKDKTAVLKVFAKMFYNHLGYFGENLKVVMLEKYIDQCGKYDEFKRVFEEKKGQSWEKSRRAFAFNGKAIKATLQEVLDMSEEDAKKWFDDKSSVEFSIAQLVSDIKEYVDKKPDGFRLLFMVDEVGQYVGTDTDMLLNLQSIVEKLGSECEGKVWVVCTGQEAIDEIIKVRSDEFSRIQARFRTRLSLSSSSVDEVIQKRILRKTEEAEKSLEEIYNENDSVLRNLFSFTDSVLDIKGYNGSKEFATDFPFVPYQFIIMQKVFAEIRKHGNSGKHLSGGERSMLSGFQEAAQKIQDRDTYALVPFYRFYDTASGFLDSSIRNVIERCDRAASDGDGLEPKDVDVLKLLYLIRYIDDIRANLDNIVILMADDIRVDKITLRESVKGSLDRLISQNYIGRNGDVYNFLTDEEQDIAREIKNTNVDTSTIVEKIGNTIFGDIYNTPKYRYGKYDFAFDKMVDGTHVGSYTGGMELRFLTVAADATEKQELSLLSQSKGRAYVVLSDTPYYESLENAMKIRKYVKQKNVSTLPKTVQDIIRNKQDEASRYEAAATEELIKAIVGASFYVDGEKIQITSGDAKTKLNQAMEYLVSHIYKDLSLITKNSDTDADIISVLNGKEDEGVIKGCETNREAAEKMYEYLSMQHAKKLPTSMADIQSRYQSAPYGWKEIDIATVAARLIYWQRVTIKYAGNTIHKDDNRLPDMLRKRSEIGRTIISIREVISAGKIRAVKEFIREYFDVMDLPEDEDSLVVDIINKFEELKKHYEELKSHYNGKKYPDYSLVTEAIELINGVLSQQKDNIAFIDYIIKKQSELEDSKEDLQNLESFFKNQTTIFDAAVKMEKDMQKELYYIRQEPEAEKALNEIRLITNVQSGKFNYRRIPELNGLIATIRTAYDRLLEAMREEKLETVRQCMEAIHKYNDKKHEVTNIIRAADNFYNEQKETIKHERSLAFLESLVSQMSKYKDETVERIERLLAKPQPPKGGGGGGEVTPPQPPKHRTTYSRQVLFPAKCLDSDKEIDEYVEEMRQQLKELLKNCDGIKLN